MSVTGFFKDIVKGALQTEYLRDYGHAAKTFGAASNYALLPKTKRWWHVYFDLNDNVKKIIDFVHADMGGEKQTTTGGSTVYRFGTVDVTLDNGDGSTKLSVLAKSVKLPNYRFDTKKYNQYNRQTIGINKINYEPITIDFHDDALNIMRNFWDAYYTYYIQDSRYRRYNKSFQQGMPVPIQLSTPYESLYSPVNTDNKWSNSHWGLDTVNTTTGDEMDRTAPFFNSIKVYHFSRAEDISGARKEKGTAYPHYSEYTLVNPVITSFEHDSLDFASSEGTVNRMSIDYETVLYNQGIMDEGEIASWDRLKQTYWDNSTSPLNNPSANLFGNTGIFNTAADILTGGTSPTSIAKAALNIGKTVATWKTSGGLTGLANAATKAGIGIANNAIIAVPQVIKDQNAADKSLKK